MKKLYEIFGQPLLKGDVGIEIECEGRNFPAAVDARWVPTQDGSLRGENREFVLAAPIAVNTVKDALESLKKDLVKTKLDFSFRTSVHVHVNVQELTYPQYLNFIYTYLLLEEPLMTFCGKERKGNRFCLRLQDAEGMLEVFHRMFRDGVDSLWAIPANQVRYSALNVEATTKYGSLEFRGMRGNLDTDVIDTWANILCLIREFAKKNNGPVDVYNIYAECDDPQDFLEKVLGGLAPALYYPKMAKDVQRSFSLSLDLPFCYNKPQEEVVKKVVVPKAMRFDDIMAAQVRGNAAGVVVHDFGAPPPPPRPAPRNPYRNWSDEKMDDMRERYAVAGVPMPAELAAELLRRGLL